MKTNMTTKDYLTLGLSFLGLIISMTAIYLGQFRSAEILATLGPEIHIYYPHDGGSALYLPITFSNSSPTRGVVYQIYLRLSTPNGMNYYLRWGEEASITERTWEYTTIGRVKPFTIDGYSSVSKVYWFLWPQDEKPSLRFEAGTYSLTSYVWSTKQNKPDILSNETLEINSEVADILAERKRKNDPHTRILYLKDRGLIATAISEDKPDALWERDQTRP